MEEEVGELRTGTMKAFLDVRASLEAKPSLRQVSELVERKLQPFKLAPPAGASPPKQGDASLHRQGASLTCPPGAARYVLVDGGSAPRTPPRGVLQRARSLKH